MKNLKRRFFIKSSSLVAGGLVLPSFNINRMANSANNKKLKVSVVGCGGRGTGAAVQALRADENVELVAMACLLYTSPSPRDVHLSRMPSSA